MPNIFFSVVIPTYNRLSLLKEALNSVIEQTFSSSNYEIIVVDDGSTDDTLAYLGSLKQTNLSIISIKHNGFAGYVRNKAILKANGKFICFLDSDDLWAKTKLEKQYRQIIENPNIKIFHTKELWLRHGKEISQSSQKHAKQGYVFDDALTKCILGPSTLAIETNFLKKIGMFNEKLEVAEDYECWLRALAGNDCLYLDEPLTIKRAGDWQALSFKYDEIENFRIMALEGLLNSDFCFSTEEFLKIEKMLKYKLAIYLAGSIKRDKTSDVNNLVAKLNKLCKITL